MIHQNRTPQSATAASTASMEGLTNHRVLFQAQSLADAFEEVVFEKGFSGVGGAVAAAGLFGLPMSIAGDGGVFDGPACAKMKSGVFL